MCLPFNISAEETRSRCEDTMLLKDHKEKEIYEEEYNCGESSFGDLLLVIILTVILLSFMVIIFYNCYVRMTGSEPFKPCDKCPDSLFPRVCKEARVERFINEGQDNPPVNAKAHYYSEED